MHGVEVVDPDREITSQVVEEDSRQISRRTAGVAAASVGCAPRQRGWLRAEGLEGEILDPEGGRAVRGWAG